MLLLTGLPTTATTVTCFTKNQHKLQWFTGHYTHQWIVLTGKSSLKDAEVLMGQHISVVTSFSLQFSCFSTTSVQVFNLNLASQNAGNKIYITSVRAFKENCATQEMYSVFHFTFLSSSAMIIVIIRAIFPSLVPFPPPQHNFHVHSHLWPQLKFMKSPQCWGLLGWRPSQERNELIVTLRLLLSISELSTAVDRRCPGPRPSITGPHHQETKQITVSQMYSPESNQVQQNTQTQAQTQLNFRIKTRGLV